MNIDNLIKNNVDFSKIGQLLNITPENRSNFWKDLIQLMRSFNNPQNNVTLQDLANDNVNSILGFINKYCDLKDMENEEREILVSEIFNSLRNVYYGTDTNGDFWNESVQNAINYLIKNFYNSENQNSQLIAGVDFTRRHIKNANAGLSFIDVPWVEPNFNVNKKTYDNVRGHDQIKDILANKNKMQFTHTQNQNDIDGKSAYNSDLINENDYAQVSENNVNSKALNKWIRLLMPQYGRRVEIEDLDRNFWVIAQVIAAISGFLFDDNSPIPQMFKKLLDEILQLWENVMYLWAQAAILSQKNNTNIKTIVLPVPNSNIYNTRKFDNFDKKTFLELNSNFEITGCLSANEIFNRIEFLKDKYSDDNLVIVPFERLLNYRHNYYGCEYYHYIYTYHRGTNQWTTYNLVWDMNTIKINGVPISLAPIKYGNNSDFFGGTAYQFSNKIYGIREEKDRYLWISPLSTRESLSLDSNKRFYGNLRIIPTIKTTLNVDSITIDNIDLLMTDAASNIVTNSNNRQIGKFSFKTRANNDLNFSYTQISDNLSNGMGEVSFSSLKNKKALYMGETVSYYNNIQKTLSVGAYEIAGYNQLESPNSYAGGSNNIWNSSSEFNMGNYTWNSSGARINVEEISKKFIEGRVVYDFAAVKLIFPMSGGQGGNLSTDQEYDNYYYYLNSYGNLVSKVRRNNYWNLYSGMMSKGLYIKSEPLNFTKFFTDYEVDRPSQGVGFVSGLYLFKKKDEIITSENWAVVSIDATIDSNNNSTYGLLKNYIYIGYGNGNSSEIYTKYNNEVIDFSEETTKITEYEFVNGRGNIDNHIFNDIIKNLIPV